MTATDLFNRRYLPHSLTATASSTATTANEHERPDSLHGSVAKARAAGERVWLPALCWRHKLAGAVCGPLKIPMLGIFCNKNTLVSSSAHG